MKFYILNRVKTSELKTYTDYIEVEPINLGEAPKCDVCGQYIGSLAWLPPFRVQIETFGDFGDIVLGPSIDLLISDRLKDLFESNQLIGFLGFEPVEVVRVKTHKREVKKPPTYFHVNIMHSNAEIDLVQSNFVRKEQSPICPTCNWGGIVKRAKQIILKPQTWSGEDVFIAKGLYGMIITSERFYDLFMQNGLTGAVLTPAEEYGFDYYPWENKKKKQ